jgi:phosphohistidine swiveling domain-containing protein
VAVVPVSGVLEILELVAVLSKKLDVATPEYSQTSATAVVGVPLKVIVMIFQAPELTTPNHISVST